MYQRTSQIRAEQVVTDGIISGTLASNGEASDGHIIEPRGVEIDGAVPLLFGHDAHSGRNNLGSWINFAVRGPRRSGLGDNQLHGTAQIELGGSGAQAEFRQDVAHMVAGGHINAFSVRWDPIGEAVARTDLPVKHYAHAGQDSPRSAQQGLYFERSRILEGSVVTIGADASALVARALESDGRDAWLAVLGPEMMGELANRLEDVLSRVEQLETFPVDHQMFKVDWDIAGQESVSGDDTPAAVTEDSAPSPRDEPESRPAPSLDQWVEAFSEVLERSDERSSRRQADMIRRIVG